jgi:SAM-dependent methyltransferase
MAGIGAATRGAPRGASLPSGEPGDREAAWRNSYTAVRKDLLAPTSWTNRRRLSLLGMAALDRSTSVLEVGSGDGNLAPTFAELGFTDVIGVEVQHELVAAQPSPARAVVGSADALPVRSSSVGAALVMDVLHHLDADGIDASPTWSPDGGQIAFVSDRHGSPQIWVMGKDGGNQRRLTFQGEYNQTPEWSPKGDKILFTARDERLIFDIFTVEVATGTINRLTQNQGNNEEPDWSPNGRYVVFSSTRTGEAKLYISTEDGRIQNQVTIGKGEYLTPTWGR